jgi:hypothetical protein
MIIVANTFTRPSKDVAFFVTPDELMSEFLTKYRYTGKTPSTTTETSEDGLSVVVTTKWQSRAVFNEFLDDALSDTMRVLRSAHVEANGIQMSSDIKYIPTEGDMDSFEPSPAKGV